MFTPKANFEGGQVRKLTRGGQAPGCGGTQKSAFFSREKCAFVQKMCFFCTCFWKNAWFGTKKVYFFARKRVFLCKRWHKVLGLDWCTTPRLMKIHTPQANGPVHDRHSRPRTNFKGAMTDSQPKKGAMFSIHRQKRGPCSQFSPRGPTTRGGPFARGGVSLVFFFVDSNFFLPIHTDSQVFFLPIHTDSQVFFLPIHKIHKTFFCRFTPIETLAWSLTKKPPVP